MPDEDDMIGPHPHVNHPAGTGERAARRLEVRRPGRTPYQAGLELQGDLVDRRRRAEIPDQLILLEHPHVLTLGSGAGAEHVLVDDRRREELDLDLVETSRGGDVTYHGPGQIVGYPILDLTPDRKDLHRYLRDLEEVLIRVASSYGINGRRAKGFTGVWTEAGKLAAIGVRVSSGWITSHGFALNVCPDLSFFETIVPCGLTDRKVTSFERLLGRPVAIDEVMERTVEAFSLVFGYQVRD